MEIPFLSSYFPDHLPPERLIGYQKGDPFIETRMVSSV